MADLTDPRPSDPRQREAFAFKDRAHRLIDAYEEVVKTGRECRPARFQNSEAAIYDKGVDDTLRLLRSMVDSADSP